MGPFAWPSLANVQSLSSPKALKNVFGHLAILDKWSKIQ